MTFHLVQMTKGTHVFTPSGGGGGKNSEAKKEAFGGLGFFSHTYAIAVVTTEPTLVAIFSSLPLLSFSPPPFKMALKTGSRSCVYVCALHDAEKRFDKANL